MKWRGRRGSDNIEDRRGQSPSPGGFGGGGFGRGGFGGMPGRGRGIPLPRGKLGLVIFVAILAIGFFTQGGLDGGLSPTTTTSPSGTSGGTASISQDDRDAGQFVSVVLADTEEVWTDVFRDELGREYHAPTLVLFSGQVGTACGGATSASGPFYCPLDRKAYLDTDFFDELARTLGAKGDFAAAYVVAHEIGHHVQNELGVLSEVQKARGAMSKADGNALQVKVELQADCFSGLWAARAQEMFGSLDDGDVDEALNAASRIGDDTLQKQAGRSVRPETFQHGTSQQRRDWFARGWNGGTLDSCDTFSASSL